MRLRSYVGERKDCFYFQFAGYVCGEHTWVTSESSRNDLSLINEPKEALKNIQMLWKCLEKSC